MEPVGAGSAADPGGQIGSSAMDIPLSPTTPQAPDSHPHAHQLINWERFGALAARGNHTAEGSSDRRPTLTHKTAVPDLRPFGCPPQVRSPGRPPQNTSKCVNREVRPSKPALLLRFNPGTTRTHLRRRFCVGEWRGGGGGDFVRHVRQTSPERLGRGGGAVGWGGSDAGKRLLRCSLTPQIIAALRP